MQKTYPLNHLDDLPDIVAEILRDFEGQQLFLLSGGLGAGKTTLVQAFCRLLHVKDDVVSPTYTIINVYNTASGSEVYHADLYRISSLDEAVQTGIEDYIYSGRPCFIEWPEILNPILPAKFVKLGIANSLSGSESSAKIEASSQAIKHSNSRIITAEAHA